MSAVSDLARELRSVLEPALEDLAGLDESQRRAALQQALGAELTPAGLLERLALVDRAEGAGPAWRALIGLLGRSTPPRWSFAVAGLTVGPQTIQVGGTTLPDGANLSFSMDPVVIEPGRPGVQADQVTVNLTLTDDVDKAALKLDVKALRLDLPGEEPWKPSLLAACRSRPISSPSSTRPASASRAEARTGSRSTSASFHPGSRDPPSTSAPVSAAG